MKKWIAKGFLIGMMALPLVDAVHAEDTITVKLSNYLGDKSVVNFVPNDTYSIKDSLLTLTKGVTYQMKAETNAEGKPIIHIYQGERSIGTSTEITLLAPSPTQYVAVEGRSYLGDVTFKNESGIVRPYNTVEFEDYVKGVVPVEMSNGWGANGGLEALKAQAVAARTYSTQYKNKVITDTQLHQVYGGYFPTYNDSNTAAESTKGEILTYNKAPISSVFSSSNGGYIESNHGAWGSTQVAYLPAKSDPFDPINPFSYSISEATLISKIKGKASGYTIKAVQSVTRVGTTDGGRTVTVRFKLTATDGSTKTLDIEADTFRALLGASNIKSTYLENPTEVNDTFTFRGKGFGHGVGMSQYGALAMSKASHSYRNILAFYFPNTQLYDGSTYTNMVYNTSGGGQTATPTPSQPEELVNSFSSTYSYPELAVSLQTASAGNVGITIEDMNGNQVATVHGTTWEAGGKKTYKWTNQSLVGQYKVKVRFANGKDEPTYKEAIVEFNDEKAFLISPSVSVMADNVTFTYGISKPSRLLIDIQGLDGKRVSVLEPYVLKENGQYTTRVNASQLHGQYRARIILINDKGDILDRYEQTFNLSPLLPSYSQDIQTAQLKSDAVFYADDSKRTTAGNLYSSEKIKVIANYGNIYEVEYNGRRGYIDSTAITMPRTQDTNISINGYQLDMNEKPVNRSGVTLVPIRWVSNGLGMDIKGWSDATQTATLEKDGKQMELTIGKKYAVVNGKQVALNASIENNSGRTYVPLRFVSEETGAYVNWDDVYNMIWIKTN